MLFAWTLITDTKGESIFNTVKDYFKENNIFLFRTLCLFDTVDNAMVDRHREFIAFLKKEVPTRYLSCSLRDLQTFSCEKSQWPFTSVISICHLLLSTKFTVILSTIDYLDNCIRITMKNSIACFYTPRFAGSPKTPS